MPPSPDPLRPSQAYYGAVIGAWRGAVRLRLTDPHALARSGLTPLNRLSVRILAGWPAWLPPVELATTVAIRFPDHVVHTSTFQWLGLPIRRSEEHFHLDPDGNSLTVDGDMTGSGRIDDSSTRAAYALRWLGIEVAQTTDRRENEVHVHQVGPGFSGEILLVRNVSPVTDTRTTDSLQTQSPGPGPRSG
jgi:hypothetical protein